MLLVVSNELLVVKFACYFHLSGSFCFGDSFWFGMLVRHAHYQTGITPLALVWKDENCSQYVMDTDSKGQVPNQQQVLSHASFVSSHCLAFHAFSLLYIYLNCLLLWISSPCVWTEQYMYGLLVPLSMHSMNQLSCLIFSLNICKFDLEAKVHNS